MFYLLTFFALIFGHKVYSQESLEFIQLKYLEESKELSGIIFHQNKFYVVADKPHDHYIYELQPDQNNSRFKLHQYINLKDLKGYQSYYYSNLLLPQFGHWLKSPLDLEGITRCGDDFYLVNEQVRHVLKVSPKEITKLEIDFLSYFDKKIQDAKSIPKNAGLEGIAADCLHRRLYIAQERNPRAILVINMDTNAILDHFSLEASPDQLYPDFAALHFENGHLYILERNSYRIIKYSLLSKKVLKSISFKNLAGFDLEKLYQTGEPYGLAEGLTMSQEKIFIVLDNNQSPLSELAKKHFSLQGNGATFLEFKRPLDF